MVTYGTGIGGTADSGHLICQSFAGDSSLSARILFVGNSNPSDRAGVMFRETLAVGSRFAFVSISGSGSSSFTYQTATNGATTSAGSGPTITFPSWVRIQRIADTFYAYLSSNGVDWSLLSSASVTVGASPQVCIVSSSYSSSVQSTTMFESVNFLPIS